jgi:hypothetical protein
MTTALDLTTKTAVQQSTFVKMTVMEGGAPLIIRMSSHQVPFALTETDGSSYTYPAVGNLLGVSQIAQDVKASNGDVTITLSGIGNNYIADIIANPIKGSPVEIRRAFFDVNGQFIATAGNPVVEFSGVVNNFTFNEDWADGAKQSVTMTASLVCSSIMSVLKRKVAGRRTNQAEQSYWFPGDHSMDRVGVISDTIFDFGGTTPSASPSATPGQTATNTVTK